MNDIRSLVEQHLHESRAQIADIESARKRLIQHLDEIDRLLRRLDRTDQQMHAAPAQLEQGNGLKGMLRAIGLQLEQALGAVLIK